MIKGNKIDLSRLVSDGIITNDAMAEIFERYTNWLGVFHNLFPDEYKNGDSFMCDGKVYQVINGEIHHTGYVLFSETAKKHGEKK